MIEPIVIPMVQHYVDQLNNLYPSLIEVDLAIEINTEILARAQVENNAEAVTAIQAQIEKDKQTSNLLKRKIEIISEKYMAVKDDLGKGQS